MEKQPFAIITDLDIGRLVKREFRDFEINDVYNALLEYKMTSAEVDCNRVRAAAIKNSNGNIEKLKDQICFAKQDYRDVVALAEYPNYLQQSIGSLSQAQKEELVLKDWEQYHNWFSKK